MRPAPNPQEKERHTPRSWVELDETKKASGRSLRKGAERRNVSGTRDCGTSRPHRAPAIIARFYYLRRESSQTVKAM